MITRATLVGSIVALLGCGGLLGPRTADNGVCGSSLSPPAVPGVPVRADATSPGLFIDRYLSCFDTPSGLACGDLYGRDVMARGITHPRDVDGHCALDADGTVKCVGGWLEGRPAPTGTFSSLFVDGNNGCALDAEGRATCFGWAAEEAPEGPLVDVIAGFDTVCGLHPDGTITCTGYDDYSCLDDPPPGAWASITGGAGAACAIDGGGNVACWGRTANLQPLPARAKVISIDDMRWCAVTPDDTLACGGHIPIEPVPEGHFRHVDIFEGLACAVRDDGRPVCFGRSPDELLPWWRAEVPSAWLPVVSAGWKAALPSTPEIVSVETGAWSIHTWVAYGPNGEEYAINEVVPTAAVAYHTPAELLAALLPTHEITIGSMFAGGTWVASELPRDVPARRYDISFQRKDGAWRKSIHHLYALPDRIVVMSFTGKPELDATTLLRTFQVLPR